MRRITVSDNAREKITYTVSSLIATGVDYAGYLLTLSLLRHSLHLTEWPIEIFGWSFSVLDLNIAYTIGRAISSVENFFFNDIIVFHRKGGGSVWSRMGKYMLLVLLVAIVGNFILGGVSSVIPDQELWSKVITDVTMFIVSYYGQKLFVFREKKKVREHNDDIPQ